MFSEDFDYIPVTEDVPPAAEFGIRIQSDSMAPYIADGSRVYVNRDPLQNGDMGIFCVDGDILCKQYYRDPMGMVFLFSLNRARSDADVVMSAASGRSFACFGRVIHRRAKLNMKRAHPEGCALFFDCYSYTMKPPSAVSTCPVRKEAFSEAKKATA